jgi:hypothetical protein
MDASCKIQGSIHVFHLVHKYVSRILGTYQKPEGVLLCGLFQYEKKRKKFSECFLQVPLRNDKIEVILRLL